MTESEAAKLVAMLVAFYPGTNFNEANARAYIDGIEDLDFESTKAAMRTLGRSEKFLPRVSEIRKAAQDEWAVRRPRPKLLPKPEPEPAPPYLEVDTQGALYLLPPPEAAKPDPKTYRHKLLTREEQLAKLKEFESELSSAFTPPGGTRKSG
jgi:hypothetical protein